MIDILFTYNASLVGEPQYKFVKDAQDQMEIEAAFNEYAERSKQQINT